MASYDTSGLPPIGSPDLVHDFLQDSVGSMIRVHETLGSAATFCTPDRPTMFFFGPEYNRVLHNPELFSWTSGLPGPKRSAQRNFLCGMFNLNGAQHQHNRRLLMPPFRKEMLGLYHSQLVGITEEVMAGWRENQVIDLARSMKDLAIRITGRVLFGLDDITLARAIEPVFEEWLACNHKASFAAFLPVEGFQEWYQPLLDVAERFQDRVRELLAYKKTNLGPPRDLLAIMLHAAERGELSEAELIGQTHTLFNSAYHTTTYALTWTLFLLAQHPEIALALHGELAGNFVGAAPTMEQMSELSLLERVIKESMRVLPPVVYFARVVTKPCQVGPYPMSPGWLLIGSHYITHHLPETFDRPHRFDPDRWLHSSPSPYEYLPFGAGARLCMGSPLALMVLKIAVALVVQRFRLTVVPGTRIDRQASLTLGPKQGIPVTVHKQDLQFAASPVVGNIHEMVELPPPHELPRASQLPKLKFKVGAKAVEHRFHG